MRKLDLTNQAFGRLKVLRPSGKLWSVVCSCGNYKEVASQSLRSGATKSCGCIRAEQLSERNTSHGMAHTYATHPLYSTWCSMRTRCNNPNAVKYANYGGCGIKVCSEWDDFAQFVLDIGEKPTEEHTLNRVDNDGPYSKANCNWATPKEQANNRRVRYDATLSAL